MTAANALECPETQTDAIVPSDTYVKLERDGYDYMVVSDGSGYHQDKTGAMCSVIVNRDGKAYPIVLAQNYTTVNRMEFQGLLETLRVIMGLEDFYVGARVIWYSDSRGTVEAVSDRAVADTNNDLWLLYDYYTAHMTVDAVHIPRDNNNIHHNLCDLHASTFRTILAEYIETNVNFNI
jgi:ribonuclease HI